MFVIKWEQEKALSDGCSRKVNESFRKFVWKTVGKLTDFVSYLYFLSIFKEVVTKAIVVALNEYQ